MAVVGRVVDLQVIGECSLWVHNSVLCRPEDPFALFSRRFGPREENDRFFETVTVLHLVLNVGHFDVSCGIKTVEFGYGDLA